MKGSLFRGLKARAAAIKRDVTALYFALKHPGTPWVAKVLAGLTAGYALSPIDLIPDFIPVLGLLDDLILLPGMIVLTVSLIPKDVMDECRARAETAPMMKNSYLAMGIIILIWVGLGFLILSFIIGKPAFSRRGTL
ncbi:MAG: DUF1232 domain-containing protein [Brevinematales bacterium]|nr:DUF1232 domain-containing protein [Brevinematales bacterium]